MSIEEDTYYIGLAYRTAQESEDTENQHGAVFVPKNPTSRPLWVCNEVFGFAANRMLAEHLRHTVPAHAIESGVHKAARLGLALEGATVYSPMFPCVRCAKCLVSVGVVCLVVHCDYITACPEHVDCVNRNPSDDIMRELGIQQLRYVGPVDEEPILVGGRRWSPKSLSFVV